jgi:hypothetical protein
MPGILVDLGGASWVCNKAMEISDGASWLVLKSKAGTNFGWYCATTGVGAVCIAAQFIKFKPKQTDTTETRIKDIFFMLFLRNKSACKNIKYSTYQSVNVATATLTLAIAIDPLSTPLLLEHRLPSLFVFVLIPQVLSKWG